MKSIVGVYFLILILMISILLILKGIIQINSCPKTMKDFNEISYSEPIEGTYLQGNITRTLGYYYVDYYDATSRRPATTYRYYLIPFGERQQKYIGIRVGDSEYDKFDKLALDASGEGYSIGKYQGVVKRFNKYTEEYLLKNLQEVHELNDYSDLYVPYYIQYLPIADGVYNITAGIICILVVGIFTLISLYFMGRKPRMNRRYKDKDTLNSINKLSPTSSLPTMEAPPLVEKPKKALINIFEDDD